VALVLALEMAVSKEELADHCLQTEDSMTQDSFPNLVNLADIQMNTEMAWEALGIVLVDNYLALLVIVLKMAD
jgi:hypothetical protein